MKKILSLILLGLMVVASFTLTACGGAKGSSQVGTRARKTWGATDIIIEDEYTSILSDKKFRRGFTVRGLGVPIYKDRADEETFGGQFETGVKFQYGKKDLDDPVWEICQWSTRYPFHDSDITKFSEDGSKYTYENKSKKVVVDTQTGEFTLKLLGSECYVYGDREPLMEWPHLLFSRDINRSDFTKIADKEEIRVVLNASLDMYEDHMTIEAHPYIHAAQCMFYLYVANFDETTNNFDDMLWLGMTIFDNRCEFTDVYSRQDSGTKENETDKYIYNVASSEYESEGNSFYEDEQIKVGSSVSINFDILPFIKTALKEAQEGGCMLNAEYENLYINGMYIGFELPGTYDIQMSFNSMDIKVK